MPDESSHKNYYRKIEKSSLFCGWFDEVVPKKKTTTKNHQAIQHRKITANCKKPRHLKLMNLALFCAWEDIRV